MRQTFYIPKFSEWFATLDSWGRLELVVVVILGIILIAFILPEFDQTNTEDEIGG